MPHLSILYTVTYYFNFPVHIYMIKVGMPGALNSPELLTTVMDGYNCCTNFQGLAILIPVPEYVYYLPIVRFIMLQQSYYQHIIP